MKPTKLTVNIITDKGELSNMKARRTEADVLNELNIGLKF